MNEATGFRATFQDFDDPPEAAEAAPRVAALREELARRGLDGFIVPHADRSPERISAAVRRAARLADRFHRIGRRRHRHGRPRGAVRRWPLYPAGARAGRRQAVHDRASRRTNRHPPGSRRTSPPGQKIGYDPWLHTAEGAERLGKACATAGATLVATRPNPDRFHLPRSPPPPRGAVVPQPLEFAGEPAPKARTRARRDEEAQGRRARRFRSARDRLDLQHPRRRRCPHAAALAFAIVPPEGGRALYIDAAQAYRCGARRARGLAESRDAAEFRRRTSRRWAPRTEPCGSTRQPRRTPSDRPSRRTAARSPRGPIRSPP